MNKIIKKSDLEKKLWQEFSKYVRSVGYCEVHQRAKELNIFLPFRCSKVLQACHKISRSKSAIKYDLRNVFCGCASSNVWAFYNQIEWQEICKKLWEDDMKYLEIARKQKYKRSFENLRTLYEFYKAKNIRNKL